MAVLFNFFSINLTDDDVYIPFEDQREEYVANDAGLLFMGTAVNLVSRPWSFDQV